MFQVLSELPKLLTSICKEGGGGGGERRLLQVIRKKDGGTRLWLTKCWNGTPIKC